LGKKVLKKTDAKTGFMLESFGELILKMEKEKKRRSLTGGYENLAFD
jgi:hypothetical protein